MADDEPDAEPTSGTSDPGDSDGLDRTDGADSSEPADAPDIGSGGPEERNPDGSDIPGRRTTGTDQAADIGQDGKNGKDSTSGRKGESRQAVYNAFLGTVNAGASIFGFGGAGSEGENTLSATGRIGASTIKAAAECFTPPAEPYQESLKALRDDHTVVILGGVGLGKRTAAVVLLCEILDGTSTQIVSLAPSARLEDLRKREYENGYGYVVFDRTRERRSTPSADAENAGTGADQGWADSDHNWRAVCEAIRDAGAYLVVTTAAAPGRSPESVRHVNWERPPLGDVVRARLGEEATDETVEALVALLPEECAMADVVRVAQRVAAGRSPEVAVNEILDQSGRREVRLWFDQKPSRRQVLEVTTLAFVTGAGDRAFETCLELLDKALAEAWPAPEPKKRKKPDHETHLAQDRALRLRADGLIRLVRDGGTGSSYRTLAFREDGYRRYVLEELSERFETAFWDAVRSWLNELIAFRDLQMDVAAGLALLSYTTFDEIDFSYLEPWSRGENGWQGQVTATYVLWFMSLDESLGAVALRTAEWWVGQGSAVQRLTAIAAFAGELGIRYPTQAAKRLWQLLVQRNRVSTVAANAFGGFFAALISVDRKAGHVVRQLHSQLGSAKKTGKGQLRYELTLIATLSVLRARSPRTGNPASMEFLREHPDQIKTITEMWAAVLCYRPYRNLALRALLNALGSLERLSGSDAERDARMLGDALGAALPEHEHDLFKKEFARLLDSSRKKPARSAVLTKILLGALDRASRAL